jgi:para-nitrobenzyl esterase
MPGRSIATGRFFPIRGGVRTWRGGGIIRLPAQASQGGQDMLGQALQRAAAAATTMGAALTTTVATVAITTFAGCASRPAAGPCSEAGPGIVCTAQGAVRGAADGGTIAFKGLPYAAAPVGARRWAPPEPPASWPGVRDGSRFGAVCPQLAGPQLIGDEDCLTLNVWTPATPPARPLPVMVFLTGGGNHAFSGQGAPVFGGVDYNGQQLVPRGVVYVSFNYRLGALGFLAHPGLSAERADQVSGNYGSLDQVAMLRWLQANIAAFGGDPKRITLFGTSAGGGNICTLMAMPAARGLFQRAAMQSSVPTGCALPTLQQAEAGTGARVAQALQCSGAGTAACLRGKPMADVVRAVPGSFGMQPRLYGPVVDGRHVPEQPIAAIERRAHAAVPVIIGNTTQETMQWAAGMGTVTDGASYQAALAPVYGAETAPRIMAMYPLGAYPTPHAALMQLTTDSFFTCQSRRVARRLARSQAEPVFRYLYSHALDNDAGQRALGAVHTIEHVMFFPWQGKYQPAAADRTVQAAMLERWAAFASGADPVAAAGPAWAAAGPADRYLWIGAASEARQGDGGAHCDFWDGVRLPSPHL